MPNAEGLAMVAVIIPCFNQGQYLAEAIESVLSQDYPVISIIVINDGSADNTREVANQYPAITYIEQENQGLSASRNRGIQSSDADYFIFLDADDILLPGSVSIQVKFLDGSAGAAFVAGAHMKADENLENRYLVDECPVENKGLIDLLHSNFIGMHSAVLFRASFVREQLYDTSLPAVEDYDLYLRLAIKAPYICHHKPMTVYRIHRGSMSRNHAFMLQTVLKVFRRIFPSLKSDEQKQAYREGIKVWTDYYSSCMLQDYRSGAVKKEWKISYLSNILRYRPAGWRSVIRYMFK